MMTSRPIEDAWQRFQAYKDPQARARLVDHHAYLIRFTANRVVPELPPHMDREDLYAAGAEGLIRAVDQFDPARQVKFETYAIALIRGAILESMRDADWVPRSVRDCARLLRRASDELERKMGVPPTDVELAAHMGISVDELAAMSADVQRGSLVSLDDVMVEAHEGGERLHLSDLIVNERDSPASQTEKRESVRCLVQAIARLPERERQVISLYYEEGRTFKEIGTTLQLSSARVFQLHGQAISRLRVYLMQKHDLF